MSSKIIRKSLENGNIHYRIESKNHYQNVEESTHEPKSNFAIQWTLTGTDHKCLGRASCLCCLLDDVNQFNIQFDNPNSVFIEFFFWSKETFYSKFE